VCSEVVLPRAFSASLADGWDIVERAVGRRRAGRPVPSSARGPAADRRGLGSGLRIDDRGDRPQLWVADACFRLQIDEVQDGRRGALRAGTGGGRNGDEWPQGVHRCTPATRTTTPSSPGPRCRRRWLVRACIGCWARSGAAIRRSVCVRSLFSGTDRFKELLAACLSVLRLITGFDCRHRYSHAR
jgi:hypothetical protein